MSDCCNEKPNNNSSEVDLENLEGLICYCFKKSRNELFDAVKNGKEKIFLDDIISKMKKPGCFCETSNPSGKCCLSDIQAFIKETNP